MASSEVEIVNSAFVKIGEEPINSLTETSKRARTANRQYPLQRDALIRRYRWNFAVTRTTLAPEGTAPPFGFESKFMLPADCLHFLGIYDDDELQQNYTASRIPHKIEGRFVLADGDTLQCFYVKRVEDPTQFDPLFSEALAWLLASDLAYHLSTGPERAKDAIEGFKQTIRSAQLADAIEGSPEVIEASDWLDSRYSNARYGYRIGPVY